MSEGEHEGNTPAPGFSAESYASSTSFVLQPSIFLHGTTSVSPRSVPSTSNIQTRSVPSTSNIQPRSVPSTSNIQTKSVPSTSNIQTSSVPSTSNIQPRSVPSTPNVPYAGSRSDIPSTSRSTRSADRKSRSGGIRDSGSSKTTKRIKYTQHNDSDPENGIGRGGKVLKKTNGFNLQHLPAPKPAESEQEPETDMPITSRVRGTSSSSEENTMNEDTLTNQTAVTTELNDMFGSHKYPTPQFLKELLGQLFCSNAEIQLQAHKNLIFWLKHYPPVDAESCQVYSEAFNLNSDDFYIIDVFKFSMNSSDKSTADRVLEFLVLMYEKNFESCFELHEIPRFFTVNWHHDRPQLKFHYILAGHLSQILEIVTSNAFRNNLNEGMFHADFVFSLAHKLANSIKSVFKNREYELISSNNQPTNDPSTSNNQPINEASIFLHEPIQGSPDAGEIESTSTNPQPTSVPSTSNNQPRSAGLNAKGFNLKKRNHVGETILHTTCKKNDVETLRQLLAMPDIDVNVRDHNGWTPLHEACNHGSYECVELLLQSPRIEMQARSNDEGITPLIDAVNNGHVDVCRLLMRYGVRQLLNDRNRRGYTALDIAQSESKTEIVSVLSNKKL